MPEVVVVTEAPAGVERAAAVAFAKRGARLGLLARGRSGLEGARTEVESAGGKALTIPTDVADARAVEEAAQRVDSLYCNRASTGRYVTDKGSLQNRRKPHK